MSAAKPPSTEQFKERVLQEWTDPNTVAAWSKWHSKIAVASAEAKEALVRAAQVEPGMQVLDIASGTGEPALTLAEMVGPEGHVMATDLGPGMIAVAKENAEKAGLTNMTFLQADAHQLPFSDRSFDRVTCRFGVMFFADLPQALGEIYRLLKPGGRVAFTVWGPLEQNPFFLTSLAPFFKGCLPDKSVHPWHHDAQEQEKQHHQDDAAYAEDSPWRYNDVTSGWGDDVERWKKA